MNQVSRPSTSVQFKEISLDQAGQRIDNFLIRHLKGVPKSHIYRLLRKGEVRVNKKRIKPEYKLLSGDIVRIPPVRVATGGQDVSPSDGLVARLEQAVLFENDEVIIINKPSGLAVHGGSGIHMGLIEAVRKIRPVSQSIELVHRLDRETSGCLMIAKKRSMLRYLQSLLREGKIQKTYNALVEGQWSERKRQVNVALVKNELHSGERIVRADPLGKPSLTEFRVLNRFNGCSLIEAKPVTGRTHQIRVHAQFAGHSLIGDDKYGNDELNRQMRAFGIRRLFLHAVELSFCFPGEKKPFSIKAPLSEDLSRSLEKLDPLK